MAQWPPNVPSTPLIGSLSIEAQDNLLRFKPDAGDELRRRRYTAVCKTYGFGLLLSDAQKRAFDEFYHDTLGDGVVSFLMNDPAGGGYKSFSFQQPPRFGTLMSNDVWRLDVVLTRAAE